MKQKYLKIIALASHTLELPIQMVLTFRKMDLKEQLEGKEKNDTS